MTKKFKTAFTLAEVLITLSIIGIVAALTIPGLVKHHNEHAWKVGKEVFQQKLEVALKSMNTQGKLSGYTTTEDFVNELKKNIKVTKVCTDDVTKCFSKTVLWNETEEPVEVTNSAVTYRDAEGYDWAETVGLQFSNGVTALMAYNKNCYADPYDNQASVSDKCLGMIVDVSANTKPNKKGADILSNGNVEKLGGTTGCEYKLTLGPKAGKCITKILAPDTGYSPLPMTVGNETIYCSTVKSDLGISGCGYGEPDGHPTVKDYWAGAVYACGGTSHMLSMEDLGYLAQEMYNLSDPVGAYQDITSGLTIDSTKSATFMALSPKGSGSVPYFLVWSSVEDGSYRANTRTFYSDRTYDGYASRNSTSLLAVCLGD